MSIMDRVRSFLSSEEVEQNPLPWEPIKCTELRLKERSAKIKAIEEHLGVFPDGNIVPLTFRQQLFFKDSISKLEYKITKMRREADEIVEIIEGFYPWEDNIKNTRLIRHFIIECLSPFKRHTLECTNSTYDEYPGGKSSWPAYIASWTMLNAAIVFFLYWIFAWGVYQGEDNLTAWGKIYGTSAAQDIILIQTTKMFILYYLPAQAMQTQLIRIRKVLSDVTMNYINANEDKNNENGNEDGVKKVDENGREMNSEFGMSAYGLRSEISVVQHMSAACRAARSDELKLLPAAWLLRQVREREERRDNSVT